VCPPRSLPFNTGLFLESSIPSQYRCKVVGSGKPLSTASSRITAARSPSTVSPEKHRLPLYLPAHEGTAEKLSRTGPNKNLLVTANGSRLGSRFALNPPFHPAAGDELT
jgi:hypothetical protein